MKSIVLTLLAVCVVATASPADAEGQVQDPCPSGPLVSNIAIASQLPAPCLVPGGTLSFETLYYQNASKVGGSALAAYPLARLVAGISDRTQLTLDAPSQLAESGTHGNGLYPATLPGLGAAYAIDESARSEVALGFDARPSLSPFATNPTQGAVAFDMSSNYRLSQFVSVDSSISDELSRERHMPRLVPTVDLGFAFAADSGTQVSTDLGRRGSAFSPHPQSFGNVALVHALHRNLSLDAGIGTAFNAIRNEKAHYISAGLTVRK